MQEVSTHSPKRASANTKTERSAKRKRVPINAEMLAGMTGVLINECLNAGLPVRTGKGKAGGLLLALDALTLDDQGLVIVKEVSDGSTTA